MTGGQSGDAPAQECVATVLFADLRGFTALAESRSPVEVLRLVNRCMSVLIEAVQSEGGSVDKFLGDGIMAAFGVVGPLHTDHAERAVRAALQMQHSMALLAPTLRAEGWENVGLGVGLETGRVVVGDVGTPQRREFTVLGDVVNVASRLTAGASPGEVVLGAGAGAAVKGYGELESLGEISIRGRRQPVHAWRLVRPSTS